MRKRIIAAPFRRPRFPIFLFPSHSLFSFSFFTTLLYPSSHIFINVFASITHALMHFLFPFRDYINDDKNLHWFHDQRNLIKIFPLPLISDKFSFFSFLCSFVCVSYTRIFLPRETRWRCTRKMTTGRKASISSFQVRDHALWYTKISMSDIDRYKIN